MTLANSLKKAAGKVIARMGGDVTVVLVSAGEYDPISGTIPSYSTTDEQYPIKGIVQEIKDREVNDLIQAGDKRLVVAAKELPSAPQTKDFVTISDVTHQIIMVKTIEQDNTPITFELILRT